MQVHKYPCSQPSLYGVSNLVLNALTTNSAAFLAYKSKYSSAYLAGLRAQLKAAEIMPDHGNRNSTSTIARTAVKSSADIFLGLYSYRKEAWPANVDLEPRRVQAGNRYFNKATLLCFCVLATYL